MCSSSSPAAVRQQEGSTTWAASVPMDDLAHAIAAAVGVQPVRQLPPPALLKLAEREQQLQHQGDCAAQQHCATSILNTHTSTTVQAVPQSDATARSVAGGATARSVVGSAAQTAACSFSSSADGPHLQPPLPIRRPTMAEVRAASPCNNSESAVELYAPSSISRSSSNSSSSSSAVDAALLHQLEEALQHTPGAQQDQQQLLQASLVQLQLPGSTFTQPAVNTSVALFDEMDDFQQQHQQQVQDCLQHSSSWASGMDQSTHSLDSSDSPDSLYFEVSSHAARPCSISKGQSLEQQQLLCQLWSQLQLPVQPEEEQEVEKLLVQQQQRRQQQHSPDSMLLLDTSSETAVGSSSSNNSSIDIALLPHKAAMAAAAAAVAGHSPRSSFDSTCSCSSNALAASGCDAAAEIDDCASSACSCSRHSQRSSSSSSVCSQKHVSWGSVTEYQLPPQQPESCWMWDLLPCWGSAGVRFCGVGRRQRVAEAALVGTAAAGLVMAVAGAAALVYARRSAA